MAGCSCGEALLGKASAVKKTCKNVIVNQTAAFVSRNGRYIWMPINFELVVQHKVS
jgi:hypothetical protein